MTYDFPQILYKHRTWKSEFDKNILLKNEIYLSSADQFNDPFDASLPYKYDETELTTENINKKLYQIGRKINPTISEEELKVEVDIRQNSGVFTDGNNENM